MNLQPIPVSTLTPNPDNPRSISRLAFEKLCESIERDGDVFMALRPIVYNARRVIIGGNQRFRACCHIGLTELPAGWAVCADDLTEEQQQRFVLIDNGPEGMSGSWDWDMLANQWPEETLRAVGFEHLMTEELRPFRPERVDITDLKPHPRNYKTHPDDQIDHVVQSIQQYGVYQNIIIARDGTILAGHGLVQAAQRMGITSLYAVRINIDPDDPKALKLMVADNEVAHLSKIDDRALSELLRDVKESDVFGLLGTGYDPMMLANLLLVTRPEREIADTNAAAEWVGLPGYENTPDTLKLVVSFASEEDRAAYCDQTGLQVTKREAKTWTTWWPHRERNDLRNVRFDSEDGADGLDENGLIPDSEDSVV